MSNTQFFAYLLVMAGSTYLIRIIPFVAIKHKIENKFIRSFLYYIPYAVLTAMTLPAALYATSSFVSALAGLIVAVILAYRNKSLTIVAVFACLAVYITELIISYI